MSRVRATLSTALAMLLPILLLPRSAFATGPLGPNGSRITTSQYGVDPSYNAVMAGTRATGLAGAYVAVAEGTDGAIQNAAAPAVRSAWSIDTLEYDVSLTLLFPNSIAGTDFFNTGRGATDLRRSDPSELALLSPSAVFRYGPWGMGFNGELQRYGLRKNGDETQGGSDGLARAQFSTLRWTIARAVDDGQLSAGVGLSVFALDVTTRSEFLTRSGTLFTTRGVAFDSGLLWRPNDLPFRLGVAVRAPVSTEVNASGEPSQTDVVLGAPSSADALWMPGSVRRSWNVHSGFAVQLGARPLNPRWIDRRDVMAETEQVLEERRACRARARQDAIEAARARGADVLAVQHEWQERLASEQADDAAWLRSQRRLAEALLRQRRNGLSRRYLLITTSLQIEGPVRDSVGIESFLSGKVDRVGERVTLSPRLGLETEPIAHWLQVRGGSYLEPGRFRTAPLRLHATAGLDVKLFAWDVFGLGDSDTRWRFGAAVDAAREYFSWGMTVGMWR